MTTDATAIITDALQHLGVLAETQVPSAEDLTLGLRRLNALIETWKLKALVTGLDTFANATQDYDLAAGHTEALGAALAIRLAPAYGAVATAEVRELARMTLDTIKESNVTIPAASVDAALTPHSNGYAYNILTDS
jgi:hypothetical protein